MIRMRTAIYSCHVALIVVFVHLVWLGLYFVERFHPAWNDDHLREMRNISLSVPVSASMPLLPLQNQPST